MLEVEMTFQMFNVLNTTCFFVFLVTSSYFERGSSITGQKGVDIISELIVKIKCIVVT